MTDHQFYFVATPIGNLQDISLRALDVLRHADYIICENQHTTKKLLSFFDIHKPLLSYHDFSSQHTLDKVEALALNQHTFAYVSDAGMPLICDPGFEIVQLCQRNRFSYTVIPGPSAFLTALVASGLAVDTFMFFGFFPKKPKEQNTLLNFLKNFSHTGIFLEAPHRIKKTLQLLDQIFPNRLCCVARELTKKFETLYYGTPQKILTAENFLEKGEFVLLIEGAHAPNMSLQAIQIQKAAVELKAKFSKKDMTFIFQKIFPRVSKQDIYRILHAEE